jgi:hypothetical protein
MTTTIRQCQARRNAMQMTRRDILGATATAAALAFTPKETLGGWEPSTQYPDPAVKILDPSFAKYRVFNASLERLATGMRWSEGPVWFGDARCVLWSDIPNNRMMTGTRRPAASASTASRRTTRTAIPATARAGSSPASTTQGA